MSLILAVSYTVMFPVLIRGGQQSVKESVDDVASFLPGRFDLAERKLRAIGEDATPYLVSLIGDSSLTFVKRRMLLQLLGRISGSSVNKGLIALLASEAPWVRGDAAALLGARKVECSLPYLIVLVEDTAVHSSLILNHPGREDSILVRDKAIEALEAITGKVLAAAGNQEAKARAWTNWWRDRRLETPR